MNLTMKIKSFITLLSIFISFYGNTLVIKDELKSFDLITKNKKGVKVKDHQGKTYTFTQDRVHSIDFKKQKALIKFPIGSSKASIAKSKKAVVTKDEIKETLVHLRQFMLEYEQAEKYETLTSAELQKKTSFFTENYFYFSLINSAIAEQTSEKCFFGGWLSIKNGNVCRAPWIGGENGPYEEVGKFNPKLQYKSHGCSMKNSGEGSATKDFSCNPLLYGTKDDGTSHCFTSEFKNKKYQFNGYTKYCINESKNNIDEIANSISDDDDKKQNLGETLKLAVESCGDEERYNYRACEMLIPRACTLMNKVNPDFFGSNESHLCIQKGHIQLVQETISEQTEESIGDSSKMLDLFRCRVRKLPISGKLDDCALEDKNYCGFLIESCEEDNATTSQLMLCDCNILSTLEIDYTFGTSIRTEDFQKAADYLKQHCGNSNRPTVGSDIEVNPFLKNQNKKSNVQ